MGDGPLEDVSLRTFVMRRITEYLIGLVIGAAVTLANLVSGIISAYEQAITFSAVSFGDAIFPGVAFGDASGPVAIATGIVDGARFVLFGFVDLLGPAAIPLLVLVTVVLVVVTVRLVRGTADSIPVISGIQTFLEGS
ncbi:hypothetical protein VB779_09360 [Haloarculaceae archaeon H-GB11]|nr:hypothetical protein [Haloarculaceae archaeon H-GB11]